MSAALVGLGANLGNPADQLRRALDALIRIDGATLVRSSGILTSRSIGGPAQQPDYCNAVALLETSREPAALWTQLSQLELSLGRERGTRWGARVIDLDLLLVDDQIVESPTLILPHPRLAVRRFVLEPAAEIAPHMVHPSLGWTIEQLWRHLCTAPPVLHLFGGARELRARLIQRLGPSAPTWTIESFDDLAALDAQAQAAPKLTVCIHDGSASSAECRRVLAARRRGPSLVIDARDEAWLWEEVSAALAGMA